MIRKTLVTLALSAGMVAGTAGVASAHECFVANRAEKGNTAAAKSQAWDVLELAHLYESAHLFLSENKEAPELPALTAAQVEQAVAMAADQGIPTSFTTFKAMIPGYMNDAMHAAESDEPVVDPKSVDGKGVDHFFQLYGGQVVGIYFAVAFGPAA